MDKPIPPEIQGDRFADLIEEIAAQPGVRVILEDGASSGEGSTEAFVKGALRNPEPPQLHSLEPSTVRFERLKARHGHRPFVHCHNCSSVSSSRFASEREIAEFCRGFRPWLKRRSKKRYLEWRARDLAYIESSAMDQDGVRRIGQEYAPDGFDAVLIDGSEFTGRAVLEDVYGARFILLDDIRGFKNYGNYRRLKSDPAYELMERSWRLRNGFAVFRWTA
jgi:hypothetical protein